jgi:anaerobic magnesium-protoporphyrin IX monomethyl ester cyclase
VTRVLLVSPPFYRLLGGHNDWPALGLGYLAAVLVQHGLEARVYHTDRLPDREHISLRGIFDGQTQYLRIVHDPSHPLWTEIVDKIVAFRPTLVGLSLVTPTFRGAALIAQAIKERNPSIKIVAGGPHATFMTQAVLDCPAFDFIVRREGEYALLALAEGQEPATIAGLTYRDERGEVHSNPDREFIADLDRLPFPDPRFDLNPRLVDQDYEMIITGRGCPYCCVFCASPRLWQRKVRLRSVENVLAELRFKYETYGARRFYFIDDTFNFDQQRTADLCRAIISAGLEIGWMCEARLDHLSRDLLAVMRQAGCKRIKLGVESGSERVLRLMKKGISLPQVRQVVGLVKEAGIDLTLYFLLGFPGETVDEARQTVALARELDPTYCSLGVVAPYCGTELYDMLQAQGHLSPSSDGWERYYHQSPDLLRFSKVDSTVLDEFLALNEQRGKSRL